MDLQPLGIKLSLEDYFKYHPPTSEARKQAHNIINDSAFGTAESLLDKAAQLEELEPKSCELVEQGSSVNSIENFVEYNQALNEARQLILDFVRDIKAVVSNELCLEYIISEAENLIYLVTSSELNLVRTQKGIIMGIQQIRMFANQGVTVDELETQLETTIETPEIEEQSYPEEAITACNDGITGDETTLQMPEPEKDTKEEFEPLADFGSDG